MRLKYIRQNLDRLIQRLVLLTIANVPEGNEVCEFDCRDAACDWERWETCERRLAPPTLRRADISGGSEEPANKLVGATDVATGVLGANSGATISNVLVVGTEGSPPLKRMEIHFEDPKQVAPAVKLLTAALQTRGFDFRTVRHLGIPMNEIWLTSPLSNGKKALMSCAASVGE